MGRKEQRIQKKLEKNPIRELNKIQNRYYSQLFLEVCPNKGSPDIRAISHIQTG